MRRASPSLADWHPTAIVDDGAEIGSGTRIWHFCHISNGARIGVNCSLGQNVFVAASVIIGDQCKIQNNVSLFDGVVLEDEVFIGPSVTFTNVKVPRAFISQRESFVSTIVGQGATLGANSTIVCGNRVGQYAFVGAGSVVTKEIPDFGLYFGNPIQHKGWVNKKGDVLPLPLAGDATYRCSSTHMTFVLKGSELVAFEDERI